MRNRFAPSPTGYLHQGHCLSAMLNQEIGDGFILRIEDIDSSRSRPHFQDAIIKDLRWLGCHFRGEIIQQQHRLAIYQDYLDQLIQEQWVYPCFCSRKNVQEQTTSIKTLENEQTKKRRHWQIDQTLYPGTCRNKSLSQQQHLMAIKSYCWRLNAERIQAILPSLYFEDIVYGHLQADLSLWGDVVLARIDKDQNTHISYHLACVVDDALQEIEMIIRGKDLLASTIIHRILQQLFSRRTPIYFHHDLIKNAKDCKLSKRDHATSLASLRENGASPQDVLSHLSPFLERGLHCYENYVKRQPPFTPSFES